MRKRGAMVVVVEEDVEMHVHPLQLQLYLNWEILVYGYQLDCS